MDLGEFAAAFGNLCPGVERVAAHGDVSRVGIHLDLHARESGMRTAALPCWLDSLRYGVNASAAGRVFPISAETVDETLDHGMDLAVDHAMIDVDGNPAIAEGETNAELGMLLCGGESLLEARPGAACGAGDVRAWPEGIHGWFVPVAALLLLRIVNPDVLPAQPSGRGDHDGGNMLQVLGKEGLVWAGRGSDGGSHWSFSPLQFAQWPK